MSMEKCIRLVSVGTKWILKKKKQCPVSFKYVKHLKAEVKRFKYFPDLSNFFKPFSRLPEIGN